MTLREEQDLGNTNGAGLTELEARQRIEYLERRAKSLERRVESLEKFCFYPVQQEYKKTPSPYDLSARRPK